MGMCEQDIDFDWDKPPITLTEPDRIWEDGEVVWEKETNQ